MATASPATASVRVDPAETPEAAATWPFGVVLRDIACGGLAGLVAGIVVAGFGGRIVMRLAAIAVPDAAGRFTENGNRIGDVTLEGSAALVLFMGLFAGLAGAVLWVTVRPWMPARTVPRLVAAMPLSIAFGTFVLIEARNPDFRILGFSAVVAAILVALVALFGLAVAAADAMLDGRLPRASRRAPASVVYAVLTIIGLVLGIPLIVPGLLFGRLAPLGLALVATGVATLAWWWLRAHGATAPPRPLALLGHGALTVSVLIGLWFAVPEIAAALGMD
jgi:hypothetical protein